MNLYYHDLLIMPYSNRSFEMCACKLQIVDDGFGPLKKETSINNLLERGPNLIFKGLKGVSLHKTSNRSTTPSIRSI